MAGWLARVDTLAGDGAPGFRDGLRGEARFSDPFGVAVDARGSVYVADAGDNNRIRKITPEGLVTTFAGGAAEGFIDGAGATAAFHTPSALAIDRRGNLYVADTGNNAVRQITPEGVVTTLAGDGGAGDRDGPARAAQFNAPLGVAVDVHGNVYVADTYNDRIRQITADGREVRTVAGGSAPGYQDGPAAAALFDTPCAIAVSLAGEIFVADTENNSLRKIGLDGQVTSPPLIPAGGGGDTFELSGPIGLAITHDNYLYVTESGGAARTWQIAPDARARVIAGVGRGFADGEGLQTARFNRPVGIAVDRRGVLYVADAANYLVRRLAPAADEPENAAAASAVAGGTFVPRLTAETLGVSSLLWPVEPQDRWHEVTGTVGEVRGSYDGESRHHFHSGVDVQAVDGAIVRAIRDEKVASPVPNWGLGDLNEGMSVGAVTYIHMRVGRSAKGEVLDAARFTFLRDDQGEVTRLRVKRGTRFRVGDAVGTINRMYHVHLNLGPWGAEINPLALPLVDFSDGVAPVIERDGIQLFNAAGDRLKDKLGNQLIVPRGRIRIVVDAYDQVDKNLARRRLGLYRLGYQLLNSDLSPAPGYEQPRVTIEFDRLPPDREAVKIAYADASGITVYGSAATRFLYEVTNTVRGGQAEAGVWSASELPAGDYILRILAADYAGNEATVGRDLLIIVK